MILGLSENYNNMNNYFYKLFYVVKTDTQNK